MWRVYGMCSILVRNRNLGWQEEKSWDFIDLLTQDDLTVQSTVIGNKEDQFWKCKGTLWGDEKQQGEKYIFLKKWNKTRTQLNF